MISSSGDKSSIVAQVQEPPQQVEKAKMGRKKIQISRIGDERNRQVTFTKRKFGLMKKAYELSVLCDCEIALIIFNSANKLFQYASTDMDKVLLKYTEYNEPHESRTNKDIVETLTKKENKGCESPEPDMDPYGNSLTPDEKYSRLNEEYQRAMHQNSMRHNMSPYPNQVLPPPGVPSPGLQMHNSPYMSQSLHPSHVMSPNPSISSPGLLQPPQVQHSVSPRPNSTGNMVDLTGSSPANGYTHRVSPCPSPGAMVNKGLSRQSPPSRQHNMRPMMPNSRANMLSPDPSQLRSTNSSLLTPAVSLTSPSNHTTNYPSPLPTSYHSNDFALNNNSIDMNSNMANYSHQWSGGSLTSGIPPGGGGGGPGNISGFHPALHSNTGHGGGTISPLAVNTMNHHNLAMTIKSEPLSPPRDSTTSSNHHILRPPSTGQNHLSPGHINHSHSNNSSPTGISHSLDYDGPMLKRPRVDHGAWAT